MSFAAWTSETLLSAMLFGCQAIAQVSAQGGNPPKKPPTFAAFRVPTPLPARKQRADVATRIPNWEQQLPEVAKQGPDFAGYFAVAQWSCGSLCAGFGILDVRTAELHSVAFNVSYLCPDYEVGTEFEYRLDSRLLIVNGALETYDPAKGETDGPCGKFYFEWDGHALKQIYSEISAPQPPPKPDARR
jgi:hypothetical protein